MRIGLVLTVFLGGVSSVSAQSIEPKKMEIADFIVDIKDLKKKQVTVTGCEFGSANTSWVFCYASGNAMINISIEAKSLDKESYRRALKECAGRPSENDRCTGSVTGTAYEFIGPGLQKAKINWDKP